jgi:hypothetical protein
MSARAQARAAGEKRYIGAPCKHGHVSGERWVVNARCIECEAKDKLANRSYYTAYMQVWRIAHLERTKESDRKSSRNYRFRWPERVDASRAEERARWWNTFRFYYQS